MFFLLRINKKVQEVRRALDEANDRIDLAYGHINSHVLDLRREIDALRAQAGLPPRDWPPVSNRDPRR